MDLITFKMNGSTHVQMLIVQEMQKIHLLVQVQMSGIKLLCVLQYILVNVICNVRIMVSISSEWVI